MVTSRIVATGAGIPSQVITNDDLAQIMDTSDEWIRQRTGIGERHISGGEDLSYYTTKAARQIIERAGIAPEDIDRSEERRVGKECRSRWSPYH